MKALSHITCEYWNFFIDHGELLFFFFIFFRVLSEFLDLIVDALLYIPSVLNGHDASEPDTEHLSTCCSNRTKQSLSNTQCCSSSIKESASCALHVNNNDSKGDKSLPEQSSQLSAPKVFKTKYNSSHETCDTEKPYAKLVNGCNCYKPSQHCQKSSYQQNNLQGRGDCVLDKVYEGIVILRLGSL